MYRSGLLTTGATIAVGSVAGCLGDDAGSDSDTDGDSGTDAETDSGTDDGSDSGTQPDAGEVAFRVEPSTTELEWGDDYSVTVTAEAGPDPPERATVVAYQGEGDNQWSGVANTEAVWRLEGGERQTETYDIRPPSSGQLSYALMDQDGNALEE